MELFVREVLNGLLNNGAQCFNTLELLIVLLN